MRSGRPPYDVRSQWFTPYNLTNEYNQSMNLQRRTPTDQTSDEEDLQPYRAFAKRIITRE